MSEESVLELAKGFTANGCHAIAWVNDDWVVW